MAKEDENDQSAHENAVWDGKPFLVIRNQLSLLDANLTHQRKPLTHFVVTDDPKDFEVFSQILFSDLLNNGYNVLPMITHEIADDYLGFKGEAVFKGIYKEIMDHAPGTNKDDVQIVRIPDISGCFVGKPVPSGRATHDFLQIPLEDSRWGSGNDPRASVAIILDANPNLPRVILLLNLGLRAGEVGYKNGFRDVVPNKFNNGVWVADEK